VRGMDIRGSDFDAVLSGTNFFSMEVNSEGRFGAGRYSRDMCMKRNLLRMQS
jgi:hypothetical protein